MVRIFKAISRISHENSKQSIQKCDGCILQNRVSIKLYKYCTYSYYSSHKLGETKWRGKGFYSQKKGWDSTFDVIISVEIQYFIANNII